MAYKVGSGSKCGAALQTSWGTSVVPSQLVNITSESMALARETGDEGNLLASRTKNQNDLMAITCDGSLSTVLRPEFADWLFKAAMGVEDDGVYTLQAPNQDLPVSTVVIDRGGIVKTYPDCTIKSVSFSCPANDYVTATIEIAGVKELAAGTTGAQTIPTSLKLVKSSYRCTAASLKCGSTTLDAENTDFTIDNGVEDAPRTYASGLYRNQPMCGQRSVTMDFSIPYSSAVDTFRGTYFVAENAPKADYVLEFTNGNSAEKITVEFNNVQLTDAGNNVGGTGLIDASFSGECIDNFTDEPIVVTVEHDTP